MGEFLDELERNKTMEIACKIYQRDKDSASAISIIECGLDVSSEEAKTIFEMEILNAALV